MKLILMMVMLATMLFSQQQKQIILGSFSIERNALFYSVEVQKNVDSDAQLKRLIDKYSLKVEYKKVGAYNVVSICAFDDNPSLFETIAVVKKHYPTAYAIRFPAFASAIQTPYALEEEPMLQEEEPVFQEEVPVPLAVAEVAQEVKVLKVKPVEVKAQTPKVDSSDESYSFEELLLLIALLLGVIGFVVYKINMKKKEEEEE